MLTTQIPNLDTKRARINLFSKKTKFFLKEMIGYKHRSNNYWLLKSMLLLNLQLTQQVLLSSNTKNQLLTKCTLKKIAISTNHHK
jgi:hypothetical protein